jgi:CubicO group peptidase (beta-lactamase class C family)
MGLSREAVSALRTRASLDVDEGHLPACQYALAMDGEVLVHETLGDASTDARFAIWSSTKPVFASVVWQLMGEGLLDPAIPVVDLWPEFGKNGKQAITLEHLLLFTAGIPSGEVSLDVMGDRAARARQIEEWTLEWEPGTQTAYHPLSAHWVMAELVSRVTGIDHREALRERVLDPLGLERLELGVPSERQGDIQRMVKTGEPATLEEVAEALGMPSLPPALVELLEKAAGGEAANPGADLNDLETPQARAAGVPGGGAVSDAASLALFYQALLHDPKAVWDPKVLHDVKTNVRNTFADPMLGVTAMRTLGLEVHGDDPTRRFRSGFAAASPETFGHGGAAGQIAWADPRSGLSFVYLTNGEDQHAVRQARRGRELSAAAVACVQGD